VREAHPDSIKRTKSKQTAQREFFIICHLNETELKVINRDTKDFISLFNIISRLKSRGFEKKGLVPRSTVTAILYPAAFARVMVPALDRPKGKEKKIVS